MANILTDALAGVSSTIDSTGQVLSSIGSSVTGGYSSTSVNTDPNALATTFRSNGIPAGAEPSLSTAFVSAQYSSTAASKEWRVRISCDLIVENSNVFTPFINTDFSMVFPYLPQIVMSHTANYQQMDISHVNYPFYAYRNSQVDEIQITGKFTVQNSDEAAYWIASVHFLRTVTKMFFGTGQNLGNPPPICILNGYGDFVYNNVPVIVKNFTVNMPNNVDYIASTAGGPGSSVTYVPTSSEISVTVQPVYSRTQVKSFNLNDFANGEIGRAHV